MRYAVILSAIAAIFLNCSSAHAFETLYIPSASKPMADRFAKQAREHLTQAILPGGSYVQPENAAELALPLLPKETAVKVVDTGMMSAMAQWCGVNGQQSFFARFMDRQRSDPRWTPKQIAYMALLHGYTAGVTRQSLTQMGDCPMQEKVNAASVVAKGPY